MIIIWVDYLLQNEERTLMQAVYRADASYKLSEQRQIRTRMKNLQLVERLRKLEKERAIAFEAIDKTEEEFSMFQVYYDWIPVLLCAYDLFV